MQAVSARPVRRAGRHFCCAAFVAALIAACGEARAQPAAPSGEDAAVMTAEQALGAALRGNDKSAARRLLSLQFTFVDQEGKIHERKPFLNDLKAVAAAAPRDVKVKIYGLVAMVTGERQSALGGDSFFLDVWPKQKRAWRALTMQDVVSGGADAPAAPARSAEAKSDAKPSDVKPYDCKNPCQLIPYRVRSPAEQDVINAFQALRKADVGHDAGEWGKHVADEFVLYRSGRAPEPKSDRIATIERQKKDNTVVIVSEIESMRLAVYGDGAVMIASHAMPDNSRPPYRAARVWVRRNGQWQMAISVKTDIKNPQ